MPDTVYTELPKNSETIPSYNPSYPTKSDSERPVTESEDQTSISSILPSSPISTASVSITPINVTAYKTGDHVATFSKLENVSQDFFTDNSFLDKRNERTTSSPLVNSEDTIQMHLSPSIRDTTPDEPFLLQFELEEHYFRFEYETIKRYFYYIQIFIQLTIKWNIFAIALFIYLVLFLLLLIRQMNPLWEQR